MADKTPRRGRGGSTHPLIKAVDAEAALNETFAKMGISRLKDGSVKLSPEALRTIQDERLRRMTISRVPSTPRWMPREAGGVGVRKGGGRFNAFSMETLRMVREQSPMFQVIHAARQAKVRRLSVRWSGRRGEVGWRVVHKDHYELDAKPPKGFEPWIQKFEKILEVPAPTYGITSTSPLLSMAEEDLLTLNRPVIEVLYSALEKRRVVGFRPVDAALIWPTQLWIEKWVSDNPHWYGPWSPQALTEDEALDLLSLQMDMDLRTAEYCLVREGAVEATYDRDQLVVAPIMNRTGIDWNGYWPSAVEMAMEVGLTFINTWNYNANFFTRGMMAEFILGVSGNVHDDDIDAFADMLRDATQGVKKAWQPPIMPLPEGATLEKIDLKPANREMMYEVFLALQIAIGCGIYRMDPSEINARPWDGSGGQHLGGDGSRGQEIELAKAEGLQGDMQHHAEAWLTPLARRCHPDLRVIFEYGDFDPKKEADIYAVRSKTSLTRNEVRLAEGLEPKGYWVPDVQYEGLSDEDKKQYDENLWNMPADPAFAAALQQRAQLAQQKDMQEQWAQQQQQQPGEVPDDDGFGQPDGQEQDGFGQPKPQTPFGGPPPGAAGGAAGGPTAPTVPSKPTPPGSARLPLAKGRRTELRPRRVTIYVEDTV